MFSNILLSFRGQCRCSVFQSPFMIRSTTKHERWVQDPNMIFNGLLPGWAGCAGTRQHEPEGSTCWDRSPRFLLIGDPHCVEWRWHDPGWRSWRNCQQLSAYLVFLKERIAGSYYPRVPFNMHAALKTN